MFSLRCVNKRTNTGTFAHTCIGVCPYAKKILRHHITRRFPQIITTQEANVVAQTEMKIVAIQLWDVIILYRYRHKLEISDKNHTFVVSKCSVRYHWYLCVYRWENHSMQHWQAVELIYTHLAFLHIIRTLRLTTSGTTRLKNPLFQSIYLDVASAQISKIVKSVIWLSSPI
jgi:hypothetical protein